MPITHTTHVTVPDDPRFPVGSDEWNAAHTLPVLPGDATTLETDTSKVLSPNGSGGVAWAAGGGGGCWCPEMPTPYRTQRPR